MPRESKAVILTRKLREVEDKYVFPLLRAIEEYQKKCKHLRAKKTPKSNTGNWDRNDDTYWYECSCPTCLKRWTEDQ